MTKHKLLDISIAMLAGAGIMLTGAIMACVLNKEVAFVKTVEIHHIYLVEKAIEPIEEYGLVDLMEEEARDGL